MKLLRAAIAVFLLASCGGNSGKDETKTTTVDSGSTVKDTSFVALKNPNATYEVVNTQGYYVWDVDVEKKTLKKNPEISSSNVNADSVINGLNRQYEDILLEKVNIKKDTINLRIKDADYLTNQIGSSGADQYIAQAVINLTSVPGIKYVRFDFKMGSHAEPGIYSRKDFPGYIIIQ